MATQRWGRVNSGNQVITVTNVHKVRNVRVNVPGTPTVDYETNAALPVPQVSTTLGSVASRLWQSGRERGSRLERSTGG
eukprot:918909-Pleurochrysis_carterae.AAC.1